MKKDFIFYTVFLFCLLTASLTFSNCDANVNQVLSREYGGTITIKLQPGEKLIEATWKDNGNIWYLTEPMDSDYVPKTKTFKESSVFELLEGTVIFIETR